MATGTVERLKMLVLRPEQSPSEGMGLPAGYQIEFLRRAGAGGAGQEWVSGERVVQGRSR